MGIMAMVGKIDFASQPLPAPPGDTPFQTPIRKFSIRSFPRTSLSPAPSSSPPQFTAQNGHHFSEQRASSEEGPSAMDPQLMAHFVTKIHDLQAEAEKRDKYALDLEERLHRMSEDYATFQLAVEKNARDTRHQNRQMEHMQGSAEVRVDELTIERDTALSALASSHKRIEVAQERMRRQEREIADLQRVYERERNAWENERQKLQHKLGSTEGHTRALVTELSAWEVHMPQLSGPMHYRKRSMDAAELEAIEEDKIGSFERSESRASNASSRDGRKSRNPRSSAMSAMNGGVGPRTGGTLADELLDEFDDENIYDEEDEDDPRASLGQPRPFSAQSHIRSLKARRVLGLAVESEDQPVEEEHLPDVNGASDSAGPEQEKPLPNLPAYTDNSTQFSPPGSPDVGSFSTAQTREKDIWGNNESKRFSSDLSTPRSLQEAHLPKPSLMVSTASQTLEPPISPPDTPVIKDGSMFASDCSAKRAEMITSSTQTTEDSPPGSNAGSRPLDASCGLDVPVIAIDRTNEASSSDRTSVMLPPQTKNAGVQAALQSRPLRSVAIQTEEIRVDQRPVKLPPHLLPSAISSNPASPIAAARLPTPEPPQREAPLPPPRRHLREPPPVNPPIQRRAFLPEPEEGDGGYLNDDGPLDPRLGNTINRPIRQESLFAGFDDGNVDEGPGAILTEADWTDQEFEQWKPPVRRTLQKVGSKWKAAPRTEDALLDRLESHKLAKEEARKLGEEFDSSGQKPLSRPKQAAVHVPPPEFSTTGLVKPPNSSKVTLFSKARLAHPARRRSPSEPTPSVGESVTSAPPYPVPTRLSSRRAALSASDGARSPTPRTATFFSSQRSRERGSSPTKKPILRKVRSAVAASKTAKKTPIYGDAYPPSPASSLSLAEYSPPAAPDTLPPPISKVLPPPVWSMRSNTVDRHFSARRGNRNNGGVQTPTHHENTSLTSGTRSDDAWLITCSANAHGTSEQDNGYGGRTNYKTRGTAPQTRAFDEYSTSSHATQRTAPPANIYGAATISPCAFQPTGCQSHPYAVATVSASEPRLTASRTNGYDTLAASRSAAQFTAPRAHAVGSVEDPGVSSPALVDALAFAMIGEWMWKYTRKRTSFSLAESRSREIEGLRTNGPRHQRWVWVLPAEMVIMWSATRPLAETVVMGKNVRKVKIESVIDVADDNPLPKSAPAASPAFHRSIQVLTPERAFKFTATSLEKHYTWLQALSYLASVPKTDRPASLPRSPLPPALPVPSEEQQHLLRPRSPALASLRKNPIRDSIRIAKGKTSSAAARPEPPKHAPSSPPPPPPPPGFRILDAEAEAAEPPHVPRLTAQTRKRSSTGPKAPPIISTPFNFRSAATSGYYHGSGGGGGGGGGNSSAAPRACPNPELGLPGLLPQAGTSTVQMDAFVRHPRGVLDLAARSVAEEGVAGRGVPVRGSYRSRNGRLKDMVHWGVEGGGKGAGGGVAGAAGAGGTFEGF